MIFVTLNEKIFAFWLRGDLLLVFTFDGQDDCWLTGAGRRAINQEVILKRTFGLKSNYLRILLLRTLSGKDDLLSILLKIALRRENDLLGILIALTFSREDDLRIVIWLGDPR